MSYDVTIGAGRRDEGLWLPQLTLDFHAKQYSALTIPCDLDIPQNDFGGDTGGAWANWLQIHVGFPSDWDIDDTFSPGMRGRLEITATVQNLGPVDAIPSVRLDTIGTETSVGSPSTLQADYVTVPTGLTSIWIQVQIDVSTISPGSEGARITRNYGSRGPDCFIRAVTP